MPTWNDLIVMLPELYLIAATCVLLLMDVFLRQDQRNVTHYAGIGIVLVGVWLLLAGQALPDATAFNGMFLRDGIGAVVKVFALLATALVFVYARPYLRDRNLFVGEFYSLTLFATLGVMFLASSGNLVMVYLGLELLTLSSFALVALPRHSKAASEAAMKYFVLSAVASGLLLYGMSMIYGAIGSLDLAVIGTAVASGTQGNMMLFGLVFLVAGIAFKFGVAPFHMWLPDVYDGAPTPVTTYIGSVSKLAAFVMAYRLLVAMGGVVENWQAMLAVLAVLSLVIGNLVAIVQTNIKRMLAYSTISHMGFVLLGFVEASPEGYAAALFYTVCYALMTTAAFGVIQLVARAGFEADQIDDYKGLNKRSPWFAGVMALAMFSLAGIPPLFGFYAKLLVLKSAIAGGFLWLALVAVVCAIIGLFYYLRVIKVMYFDAPAEGADKPLASDLPMRWVLSLNGLVLLILGLWWSPLLAWCLDALHAS